jgi:membrane protease YdiL (CAAX protease family)
MPTRVGNRRLRAGLRAGAALPACLLLLALALPSPARAVDPELAGAVSLLLPGAGQAANGNLVEGGVHLGLSLVLSNQYLQRIDHPDYLPPAEREDEVNHTIRINRATVAADLYGTAALDLSFYSSFGAYRDARLQPGRQQDYATPPPRESLTDLALSPYRWEFLSRPTAWVPLLVPLYLALSPARSPQLIFAPDDSISRNELRSAFYVTHAMVAVGEEAFFRGFLNNGLSDRLGEGWGLAASSALFGLAHEGNAAQANALGAAIFGAYLGWLQQRNGYAIGEGVAIHFWWNFLTSLALVKTRAEGAVQLVSLNLRF